MGIASISVADLQPGAPILGAVPLLKPDGSAPLTNKAGEPSVINVSARFLSCEPTSSACEGRLIVRVEGCTNLKKMDTFNDSDPYVVVKAAGKTFQTETIQDQANPVWGTEFFFTQRTDSHEVVQFEVMDQNVSGDKIIGICNVPVDEATSTASWTVRKQVQLTDSKGNDVKGKHGSSLLDVTLSMFRLD